MNLEKALLAEHSKLQTEKIVRYIGVDKSLFKELMKLFFENEPVLSQRAAWVMSTCVERHPELIKPFLKQLIYNLDNTVHDAVKRNSVRILQDIDIPDDLLGKTADICFKFLGSSSEPIAVKVFSMTVLLNITKKEPDLRNELKIMIEDQMPFASAGFQSRGQKVLKNLNKFRN